MGILHAFRPLWQWPAVISRYRDVQPPPDETIAALQKLRDEMYSSRATRSSRLLTMQLVGLIDCHGYDEVLLRLRSLGHLMRPTPGSSLDPRR